MGWDDGAATGPRTGASPEPRGRNWCHYVVVGPPARTLTRALTWTLTPGLLTAAFVVDVSRAVDAGPDVADVPVVLAVLACWLVGVVVTGRSFAQPAGWAFLGLSVALAWSAFTDVYAAPGPDAPLPGDELFATLSDSSFVWWFVFLALVLLYTPPDHRGGGIVARLPAVTIAAGVAFQVFALLRSTHLGPPREEVVSPLAVESLSAPMAFLAAVSIYLLGACLFASVFVLIRSWRQSDRDSRRQLLWLVAGALPVAPVVVAAFAFSWVGETAVAGALLGVAIVCLVAGAALSVLKYRLYDVERVVTESGAYAIASGAVVLIFVAVIVVISNSTPIEARSQLPTVAATLAGVAVARASYVWGRRAVGRRVNPTRFDAIEKVRAGLAEPTIDLDALVVAALGDHARVTYPTAGGAWVTSKGHDVRPGSAHVDVHRQGALTARVEYDPALADQEVVEAVAAAAASEIDNVALRAELARQVEVVTESRARLATAHLEERRRIERDLHDGAQQRLLAIALQLQAARVNGEPTVLAGEVDRAVVDLGETVQELRELAAGLQPAALAGGGLLAAVVDLTGRIPLRTQFDVVDRRFPAAIEAAAWFVIAEAMANVVKHADSDEACIVVTASDSALSVVITDRGAGGADAQGSGLRGLADRVSALGGTFAVRDGVPHGTHVEAVLPCAS
jgi:signal transduction histidine kinase